VWDDQQQRLLWVDILPGLVHRFDPATGGDEVFPVGKPAGAVGLRREGGLVIAVEDGFALLDQGWQRLHQIPVIKHATPRARFNDDKCDQAGRFLAGTMAYDLTPGAGSLYRLDPDRSVTRLLPGVTISNGLAWTGSGATLYYINSPTQGIDAFDYDLGTGRLANRRRLVEIPPLGCAVRRVGGAPVHAGREARRHAILPRYQHHLSGLRWSRVRGFYVTSARTVSMTGNSRHSRTTGQCSQPTWAAAGCPR
jgi:hypothetical protein